MIAQAIQDSESGALVPLGASQVNNDSEVTMLNLGPLQESSIVEHPDDVGSHQLNRLDDAAAALEGLLATNANQ